MQFDVESHLSAIERSVSLLERDGQPASTVMLSRAFQATCANLWDAVTNRDRISHWFLPITGELALDGRFQLEGNAGGVVTTCAPLAHLAFTWEFAGDTSWVDIHMSEEGENSAGFSLTHTARISEHWREYGPGAVGVGWELGLLGLALHLIHPTAPMPDENTFATSSEGKALVAASTEGWRKEAVAIGTDSVAATNAAQRTAAFYTGEVT